MIGKAIFKPLLSSSSFSSSDADMDGVAVGEADCDEEDIEWTIELVIDSDASFSLSVGLSSSGIVISLSGVSFSLAGGSSAGCLTPELVLPAVTGAFDESAGSSVSELLEELVVSVSLDDPDDPLVVDPVVPPVVLPVVPPAAGPGPMPAAPD